MIANTWYCIAQTSTFDTSCSINVAFDGYDIQFSASVRFGVSSINITRCNLPYDIVFSLRLRESGTQWFIDLFSSREITPNITIADSSYWQEVNATAGIGNVTLVLSDITSKFNTAQGGGTGGLDIEQLEKYLLTEGYRDLLGLWHKEGDSVKTDFNVVSKGDGVFGGDYSGGGGSGTGGLGSVILETPNGNKYESDNDGVIKIPQWATTYQLQGLASEDWVLKQNFISKDTADKSYASKGELDIIKGLWSVDENGNLHTTYNIVVDGDGIFGGDYSGGGSDTPSLGKVSITIPNFVEPFESDEFGNIRLPAYPTELKNPKALKINGVSYDGSAEVEIDTFDESVLEAYIKKDTLLETDKQGNPIIKKDFLPQLQQGNGITIDKSVLKVSMKVDDDTFGFNDNDELILKKVDGGYL